MIVIGKEDFNPKNLETIVTNYPYRKNLPKEDVIKGIFCYCLKLQTPIYSLNVPTISK